MLNVEFKSLRVKFPAPWGDSSITDTPLLAAGLFIETSSYSCKNILHVTAND